MMDRIANMRKGTKNKIVLSIIVFVIIAIVALLFYIYKKPSSLPEQLTDHTIQSLEYKVEQLEETIKRIDRNIKKEVQGIREKTKQEISTMSDDSIADELNRELDLWRSGSRMETRP